MIKFYLINQLFSKNLKKLKEKIILDTDIGSDIDDAVCLAYLLSNPECEIIGITTVSGHTKKRAMIASYLCEKSEKNIPIFPGMEEPFIGEQKQKAVPQYEFLEKISYKKVYEKDWFNFLRNKIRENKAEVNLITIGPLTNIGILFKIDPEIPYLLKALYIMGGAFFNTKKKIEWNISCDPYAASVVFSSGVRNIYVCGLDVTTKVKMEKEKIIKEFTKRKILKEVLNFAEIWFREREIITFHDPIAASILFEKKICKFKNGKVFIDQIGATGFIDDEKSNVLVASEIDTNFFFSHFFKTF